jgi:hypothetical protein
MRIQLSTIAPGCYLPYHLISWLCYLQGKSFQYQFLHVIPRSIFREIVAPHYLNELFINLHPDSGFQLQLNSFAVTDTLPCELWGYTAEFYDQGDLESNFVLLEKFHDRIDSLVWNAPAISTLNLLSQYWEPHSEIWMPTDKVKEYAQILNEIMEHDYLSYIR